jgi:hypothetical protein
MLFLVGCSTLETVNRGAKTAGKGAGQVMRLPNSAAEGAAEGIAGQPESNPYNR